MYMRKHYIIAGLILIATLFLTSKGIAHDWYPLSCCAGHDCAPIPCESIIEKGRSLMYQGLEFSGDMIKNSEDHQCHACIMSYSPEGSEAYRKPMCIFIQNGS